MLRIHNVQKLYVQVTVHRDKLCTKQPTRCIKYPEFILSYNSTCFGHLLCPSSGVICCTHGNWYVSCRLCDRFLAESGWNSWWWAQRMPETCRVLWQNTFWIFDAFRWPFEFRPATSGFVVSVRYRKPCCCSTNTYHFILVGFYRIL